MPFSGSTGNSHMRKKGAIGPSGLPPAGREATHKRGRENNAKSKAQSDRGSFASEMPEGVICFTQDRKMS
jgi:hypothetical protein